MSPVGFHLRWCWAEETCPLSPKPESFDASLSCAEIHLRPNPTAKAFRQSSTSKILNLLFWLLLLDNPFDESAWKHLKYNRGTHAVGLSHSDLWTSLWWLAFLFHSRMNGGCSSNYTRTQGDKRKCTIFIVNLITILLVHHTSSFV